MEFRCAWAVAGGAHSNEGIVLCGGHGDGGVVCVLRPRRDDCSRCTKDCK